MYKKPSRPLRQPVARSLLPDLRREVLLYVEDDDDNWAVAELRLGKSYEMVRARTDREACDVLRERRFEIDVVLMDIELRGCELNGVELTQLLRGNRLPAGRVVPAYARDLPPMSKPVIYVTANGARYTSVQLMLSGADKVIAKPVDFQELQTVLSDFLMERTSV
jgi:CheY-like chemotaxis protein